MPTPTDALRRLREGNRRFVEEVAHGHVVTDWLREQLVAGQNPCAIVLGCSDSRVPPEIVFDQRPGDLFVIRIAGNVATPEALGSAEFAAVALGTRLIVVLGHSGCGAVEAALKSLDDPTLVTSRNLAAIVETIRPSAEAARAHAPEAPFAEQLDQAVHRNVCATVEQVSASEVLADLVERAGLVVVGAEYDLESGRVDFLTDLGAIPA